MYIVGAIERGIAELEDIYFGVPPIFPLSADNLALFVRALSLKRIDARFARNYFIFSYSMGTTSLSNLLVLNV